jgi:hypothetical protein
MLDDPSSRFLRWAFGNERGRVLVCSFKEDPAVAPTEAWSVRPAGSLVKLGAWPPRDDHNNYFCVSLFKGTRRQEAFWDGLYVLAFDDVGVKVPEAKLLDVVGAPGWVIETSPGNFQWFYKFGSPVVDLDKAKKAVSMVRNDARDLTRLMRLPVGANTKAACGDGGFRTRLVEFAS